MEHAVAVLSGVLMGMMLTVLLLIRSAAKVPDWHNLHDERAAEAQQWNDRAVQMTKLFDRTSSVVKCWEAGAKAGRLYMPPRQREALQTAYRAMRLQMEVTAPEALEEVAIKTVVESQTSAEA